MFLSYHSHKQPKKLCRQTYYLFMFLTGQMVVTSWSAHNTTFKCVSALICSKLYRKWISVDTAELDVMFYSTLLKREDLGIKTGETGKGGEESTEMFLF